MRAFGFFCTGLVQGSSGGGAPVFVNFVKHIFPAFHGVFCYSHDMMFQLIGRISLTYRSAQVQVK